MPRETLLSADRSGQKSRPDAAAPEELEREGIGRL